MLISAINNFLQIKDLGLILHQPSKNFNKTFTSHLTVPKLMPLKKIINRHIATVHNSKIQGKEFKYKLCNNVAFTQEHNLKIHIESIQEGKMPEK